MPAYSRKLLALGCCAFLIGMVLLLRERESTSAQGATTELASERDFGGRANRRTPVLRST